MGIPNTLMNMTALSILTELRIGEVPIHFGKIKLDCFEHVKKVVWAKFHQESQAVT